MSLGYNFASSVQASSGAAFSYMTNVYCSLQYASAQTPALFLEVMPLLLIFIRQLLGGAEKFISRFTRTRGVGLLQVPNTQPATMRIEIRRDDDVY